jgi:hypothetical protein
MNAIRVMGIGMALVLLGLAALVVIGALIPTTLSGPISDVLASPMVAP